MADWIDDFIKYTDKIHSPKRFRLWSGITAVSGILERKVWTEGINGPLYPNLFTILVGPPASGKTTAINKVRELWARVRGMHLSPDNVTQEAMVDALARSLRTIINGAESAYTFSAMSVPCSEFGVFFPAYDPAFLSLLNYLYDDPPAYREERRTMGKTEIIRPHLVILAGTQPDYLGTFLPDVAWGMGFTSRLTMIYSPATAVAELIGSVAASDPTELATSLSQIFNLKGEYQWTEAARLELNAWNNANCPPTPTHNKLSHYNGRRGINAIKLAMISAASRTQSLRVTLEDFERAQEWLIEAETVMPDIFRAMVQRSDAQLIRDLHHEIYQKWASVAVDKRQPVLTKDLYQFLHDRCPSERVHKIIEVAEKSGYIKQGKYPGEWIPRPLNETAPIE